jgi:hypothetical protein
MLKVTIILPRNDNEGNVFQSDLLTGVEKMFLAIVPGFTSFICSGQWPDSSGKIYVDHNVLYEFLVSGEEQVQELKDYAIALKSLLKQESIFFDVQDGHNVSFL